MTEAICAQWSVSWKHVDWVWEVCGIRCGAWPQKESNSHTPVENVTPQGSVHTETQVRLLSQTLPTCNNTPKHRHPQTNTHIQSSALWLQMQMDRNIIFLLISVQNVNFRCLTKCHTLWNTSRFKISITAMSRFSQKAYQEEMITLPLCDFYPNDGDALANC